MSSTAQLTIYGAVVLAPFAVNYGWHRKRGYFYTDALWLSILLIDVWILTNCIGLLVGGGPDSKAFHPVIDLIASAIVAMALLRRVAVWKMVLLGLYLLQVLLGSAFWLAWAGNHLSIDLQPGITTFERYKWLNNYLWFGQVFAVSWPGGSRVAYLLGARFHRRRWVAATVASPPSPPQTD